MNTRIATLIFLMTAAGYLWASGPNLNVTDPVGDDHGAGYIVYPGTDLWEKGELDLVNLSAEVETDGIWFEAEFHKPIKSPDNRVGTFGDEELTQFLRYEFFNVNLEIYLDQVPESGNTWTLPGRQAYIHPTTAWEKAIILSPRPRVLKSQLTSHWKRALKKGSLPFQTTLKELDSYVEDHLYFPTRIKVSKRAIRFFVPLDFLGETPGNAWHLTAFTTAANPTQSLSLKLPGKQESPIMTVPVEGGWPRDTFGTGEEDLDSAPAVIDYLCSESGFQERIMRQPSDMGISRPAVLVGIPWMTPEKVKAPEPISMEKLQPAAKLATPPSPEASFVQPPAPQPGTDVKRVKPLKEQKVEPQRPPRPEKTSAAERLKELKSLLDQGLITKEEYEKIRTRILSEL